MGYGAKDKIKEEKKKVERVPRRVARLQYPQRAGLTAVMVTVSALVSLHQIIFNVASSHACWLSVCLLLMLLLWLASLLLLLLYPSLLFLRLLLLKTRVFADELRVLRREHVAVRVEVIGATVHGLHLSEDAKEEIFPARTTDGMHTKRHVDRNSYRLQNTFHRPPSAREPQWHKSPIHRYSRPFIAIRR